MYLIYSFIFLNLLLFFFNSNYGLGTETKIIYILWWRPISQKQRILILATNLNRPNISLLSWKSLCLWEIYAVKKKMFHCNRGIAPDAHGCKFTLHNHMLYLIRSIANRYEARREAQRQVPQQDMPPTEIMKMHILKVLECMFSL